MGEYEECEPNSIAAVCEAAADITCHAGAVAGSDVLFTVAMLRAGAVGWREAVWAFKAPYNNRKPLDARHDAALSARYAKDADSRANILCKKLGLPYECQGDHEHGARLLWINFRNLYVATRSHKTCWNALALSMAKDDLSKLAAGPHLVDHGGTPDRIAAWNKRETEEWTTKERKARANYTLALANLAEETPAWKLRPQYEHDDELMSDGFQTSEAIIGLVNSYHAAIAKAKLN
jgi:hypothetical protein